MRTVAVILALLAVTASQGSRQADDLLRRWVGTHHGRPLYLDFYDDTMLVVNDEYPTDFLATRDSLIAMGDTSFAVSYWLVLDRLLIETEEGRVVTMAQQDLLARPLHAGRWRGTSIGGESTIELRMARGGNAAWRRLPGGRWTRGEWDRNTRLINFTWEPDSTSWTAFYDPYGNALQFEELEPGSGTVILRRAFRW